MKKIEFYFDFLSPFSYLAFLNFHKLVSSEGLDVDVEYYPILMAKLFAHHETKGPAQIESKRDYLLKEIIRYTYEQDIPFTMPARVPFNPLYSLRIGVNADYALIDTIFKIAWQDGLDIGDPEILERELSKRGHDGKLLLEKSFLKESKEKLRANIQKAIGLNLFGVPSFVVEGELFWGNDSLLRLRNFLNCEDNLDIDKFNRLKNSFY